MNSWQLQMLWSQFRRGQASRSAVEVSKLGAKIKKCEPYPGPEPVTNDDTQTYNDLSLLHIPSALLDLTHQLPHQLVHPP
jgi:hypothetical protein